jgi:hypothetical protein
MNRKTTPTQPAEMQKVQRQFAQWRSAHPRRSRLSEQLWSNAVTLAKQHGVSKTASALGLDYYCLKKRMPVSHGNPATAPATFMELIAPANLAECIVELQSARGEKMRIDWKGSAPPDLIALSRVLWGRKP